MTDLQRQAIETVHRYYDIGNDLYELSLPYPKVSFRLRGLIAGQANIKTNTIKLNVQLLEENGQMFLDRTPGHEVAHIFAFKKYGVQRTPRGRIQAHGWAWKRVMRDFGLNPSRCHSYDTSNTARTRQRTNRPYIYDCPCGSPHRLTAIRHRRAMMGSVYICSKCRKPITFSEIAA
jgi:SprT protein